MSSLSKIDWYSKRYLLKLWIRKRLESLKQSTTSTTVSSVTTIAATPTTSTTTQTALTTSGIQDYFHWLLLAITKGVEGGKSYYNFIDFFVVDAFINGKLRPCCWTWFIMKCVKSVSLNFNSKVQRLKHVHRSMLPTRRDSCSASFGQSCRN